MPNLLPDESDGIYYPCAVIDEYHRWYEDPDYSGMLFIDEKGVTQIEKKDGRVSYRRWDRNEDEVEDGQDNLQGS